MKGSSAFLDENEVMQAAELLKGAVMISAGDAIYALCEAVEPSQTLLMQKINELLTGLNIDAEYTDINGTGVKMSANDLLKLGRELAQSKTYTAYSSLTYYELVHQGGRKTELASANKLLRSSTGCFGLATGSSPSAGYSGVYAVRRGDVTYICAIVGAQNNAERSATVTEMFEYAFSAYKATTVAKAGKALASQVPVENGTLRGVDLISKNDVKLLGQGDVEYTKTEDIPEKLRAPLSTQDVVGTITYTDPDGNVLAIVELSPAESVEVAAFAHHFRQILLAWLHK
jgi:D-alanyl-D-alanine carboxypeptidase (penicillin-binding protein 5/6)